MRRLERRCLELRRRGTPDRAHSGHDSGPARPPRRVDLLLADHLAERLDPALDVAMLLGQPHFHLVGHRRRRLRRRRPLHPFEVGQRSVDALAVVILGHPFVVILRRRPPGVDGLLQEGRRRRSHRGGARAAVTAQIITQAAPMKPLLREPDSSCLRRAHGGQVVIGRQGDWPPESMIARCL